MYSKSNKLFEIEEYNLFDDEIEVTITRGEQEKTISVPRERFERWLENNGRLDYCRDWADYSGEHQQDTGTMTIEDYWDWSTYREIKSDLYDFIVTKMMDVRKVFDVQTPLKNILNTYKTAI